jgi:predicted NBD/HSP70 family sugar kinase
MGWTCSCGQTGHLGALASGTAWLRRMTASGISVDPLLEGSLRTEESQTGAFLDNVRDPRMIYALEDIGRLIGRALAAPILLLDPHSITLTGSFAVEHVRKGLESEREMLRHVFGDAVVVQTAPRDQSYRYIGVRGAALAVIRRRVYRKLNEHLTNDQSLSELTFTP